MKLMLVRHLVSVAALPLMVAVVIPIWLAARNGTSFAVNGGALHTSTQIAGVGLAAIGLLLFASSLRRFATDGEGTLAPWDPPRRLVVRGPYRYVRNPMISGVLFLLVGEALILVSRPHLSLAVVFGAVNAVYIPLYEEPRLRGRFGAAYVEYCRHVPRFIPRLRPWSGPAGGGKTASREPAPAIAQK
jgi:protein-S-isoprenylcysteine O-methyltransferase Ste14